MNFDTTRSYKSYGIICQINNLVTSLHRVQASHVSCLGAYFSQPIVLRVEIKFIFNLLWIQLRKNKTHCSNKFPLRVPWVNPLIVQNVWCISVSRVKKNVTPLRSYFSLEWTKFIDGLTDRSGSRENGEEISNAWPAWGYTCKKGDS